MGKDVVERMIDTHSHLLPGLDDGSPDIEASLKMAAATAATGTAVVVCTPHLREADRGFVEQAKEAMRSMRAAIEDAGIELELVLGFELGIDVVAATDKEELRSLVIDGSGGALLVEVPHWGWPVYALDTVFRVRTEGFLPILAHPERNDRIQRSPDLLSRCLDAGAIAQGTASSLHGDFGRAARQTLLRMLSRGDLSLLASDAHFHRESSWALASMLPVLSDRLFAEELDVLLRVNPGTVLSGGRPRAIMPAKRRPSWLGRLGGVRS